MSVADYELPDHLWASGNCFWFQQEVFADGRRFFDPSRTQMESDAQFMMGLAETGSVGVAGPDAIVWHRVQSELLEVGNLKGRAARTGRAFADVRLRPFRKSNPKACQFRDHPLFARAYCLGHLLKSYLTWCWLRWFGSAHQTGRAIHCEHLIAYYAELLRIAAQMPEYRVRLLPRRPTLF
jgi:hypothetical protein